MSDKRRRLPENVEGNFFVDSACFNCGLSRRYAPTVFGDTGSHAFVQKQPETDAELLAAKQALLVCPTGSIGTVQKTELQSALHTFPMELAPGVFLTGFNSRLSYGADSYFVQTDTGNWLIDSPRFTRYLVDYFAAAGGLDYILLTHRDDVADANKYAARFAAKRIIHEHELSAQPDAEMVLEGESTCEIGDAVLVFTPGHTRGHVVMLWQDRYLFTGDHLAWFPDAGRLGSFNRYCWYSWEEQIRSVAKLAVYADAEWVLPGHGRRKRLERGSFPRLIREAVAWMETL